MKYFTYTLKDIGNGEKIGPASVLPSDSTIGVFYNNTFYGCAEISTLDCLDGFAPQEVSAADFYTANGQQWEAFVATGFTKNGVTFDISDAALARWTQALVLLREGSVSDTASFSISDVDGVLHAMTVGEVRSTLVELGMYWNQGWASIKMSNTGSI